jgi:hypothetical protein
MLFGYWYYSYRIVLRLQYKQIVDKNKRQLKKTALAYDIIEM